MHKKAFNPAKNKKSLPYDYPFATKEPSVLQFLTASDPYAAPVSERLRNQWVEESKILYGEFKHSGP